MQPVQVRRGLVWAAMVAMLALPAATWFAGGKLSATSNQTDAIQEERVANILRSCREQNDRHDATIRQLRVLVDAIRDRAQRERARQGMAGTIALIDALAPKRDCDALVVLQAPSTKPPDHR